MKLAALSFFASLVSFIPTFEQVQYFALVVSILAGLASMYRSLRRKP